MLPEPVTLPLILPSEAAGLGHPADPRALLLALATAGNALGEIARALLGEGIHPASFAALPGPSGVSLIEAINDLLIAKAAHE